MWAVDICYDQKHGNNIIIFRKNMQVRSPKVLQKRKWRPSDAALTEASISQWALIEALAFAERAGVLICIILFLINHNKDFWTVTGVVFTLVHLLMLSPVYGILVFGTERLAYKARGWIGRRILTPKDLKALGRAVHIFWFPVMLVASRAMFEVYYQLLEKMKLPFT